jgi:hypothetical protein
MPLDDSIPGRATVREWPVAPRYPLRLWSVDRCRDGGPRHGTIVVELIDAAELRTTFFFDRFLGRLCLGSDERDDSAAFVKKDSSLERELYTVLPGLAGAPDHVSLLRDALAHASTYAGEASRVIIRLPWPELDALILANAKLVLLARLRELGLRSLPHGLELLTVRHRLLRATRSAEFSQSPEEYWDGFYS